MKQALHVLLVFLLGSATAYSQVPDTPPTPSQTPEAPADSPQVAPTTEAAQIEADGTSESETKEGEDAMSRFIPTEQISQDLGVSFPADI
jgi:cytoskeletal protein RodZ